MPKSIIRNGSVASDDWQVIDKNADSVPAGENLLLPLPLFLQHAEALKNRQDIGVWLDSDEMPEATVATRLSTLPVIAVNFPVFTDGRGFSIGRLLRERYGFRGELRAIGYVLRDQLCFLHRCGFNAFELPAQVNLQEALASLSDFTEYYQSAFNQPQPLFRRTAV